MEVGCNREVLGDPPSVNVILVSFTSVKAAPVGICEVVARVPDVGKVTEVGPVIVSVDV